MPRKRNRASNVPALPLVVQARVNNRTVGEITFCDDGVGILSVVLTGDPAGLSGPDRERAAASVVQANKHLDPKEDHNRIYSVLFGGV